MDIEELREEIAAIVEPEPDPDLPVRDVPHPRLRDVHGLDDSYLVHAGYAWEGSTIHPHTRICPADADRLHTLTRNSDVPTRLFEAALRLFADSIVAYHEKPDRTGELRYYPPIVLTFWSGFETFVRHASELALITVKEIPDAVAEFLREFDASLDRRGNIVSRTRYQPVLERYAVLLKYGYHHDVDRGAKYWQGLESSRTLRDYYTHLDVTDPRSLSTGQVLDFTESVLLGIIWPSCKIRRTQLLGVYNLYWTAKDDLRPQPAGRRDRVVRRSAHAGALRHLSHERPPAPRRVG